MLRRVGTAACRAAARRDFRTDAYGLARTLIALGTLSTLLFSHSTSLFRPGTGIPQWPVCASVTKLSLFCVFGQQNLELARWVSVAVLLVVASGWRPRWTGLAHWYVAWSLILSAILVDGGDQIAAILALLLVPVTLADGRRWHWDPAPGGVPSTTRGFAARLVPLSFLFAARLQVAGIYLHASVGKLKVEEWRDGTAVYYWFTDAWFGFPSYLQFLAPALNQPLVVAGITWGAIVLELFLFTGLVMERRWRPWMMVAGMGFHLGIAAVHGLLSFALAMWGGLILFLWPLERPFEVRARALALSAALRARLRAAFPALPGRESPVAGD